MLTDRDRRAIRYGTSVVVASVLLLRGGPGVVAQARNYLNILEARQTLLRRARTDLAALPRLEDSASHLRERLAGIGQRTFAVQTSAEAIVQLTSVLQQAALEARMLAGPVTPLPDSAVAGSLRRVSAAFTLEGDVRGLVDLLRRLGSSPVPIAPTRLQVAAPTSDAGGLEPERLRVEMEVEAWYFPPPGPS